MAKQAKKTSSGAPPKPLVQATARKTDAPSPRHWGLAGVLVLALVAVGLGINNWMRFDEIPDWQADINGLHSAIATLKKSAQKDEAREARISALEAQIAKFESTLREIQSRPAPTIIDGITSNTPDIASAVRSGAPFTEMLHEAIAADARWQALEKWAQNPPPTLDQLWQDMQARIPESIADTIPDSEPETAAAESASESPPTEPKGWAAWLAPFTKLIQLRPLNPQQDAADALRDAIARRDSTDALQAVRTLSGNPQDMATWQKSYADRRALNQTLDRLMRGTEQ